MRDECWEWRGARSSAGYGQKRINGKVRYTHRAAFEWVNGPLPSGMQVLHRCDNPPCCNPAHLFLGTNDDNIADSVAKGRRKGVTRSRPAGLRYAPHSMLSRERRKSVPLEMRVLMRRQHRRGMSIRAIAELHRTSYKPVWQAVSC